jgi:hypothetical protein
MTTRSKTRKASAADLKKIAALDFEPLKDSKEEALRYFDLDAINNPYLVNCSMASMVMIKSKPELIEMIKEGDGDVIQQMLDGLDESSKFFKGVAELLEAARMRLIVAGLKCTEAA